MIPRIDLPKQELSDGYLLNRHSTRELAKIHGVSRIVVTRCLKRYGIPIRHGKEAYPHGNAMLRLIERGEYTPSGCWNWLGTLVGGYGQTTVGSDTDGTHQRVGVHRLSASIWKGFDLNSSLWVLHKCDNPACFNPDHLFIGDHHANVADCVAKGRFKGVRGENHYSHKLTESLVVEMRLATGNHNKAATARHYGVARSTVRRILERKTWTHVPEVLSADSGQ